MPTRPLQKTQGAGHPGREQIRLAYPMLDDFVAKKYKFDPDAIFSSSFYERYFVAKN
jgi:hypothetical protein